MKVFDSITIVSAVVCCCFLGVVQAHSSSVEAVLKTGGVVGCGGLLTSARHRIVGSLQLAPGGVVTGGNYRVSGGIIGAAANVIIVDPLESAPLRVNPAAQSLELTVDYSGGAEGAQGRLYYRSGGQSDYMTGEMTKIGNSSFSFSIDSDLLGVRGLEYYGEVLSADQPAYTAGGPSNPRAIIVELDNTKGQRPAEFRLPNEQYRIVGVPIDPTTRADNSVMAVFEDDLGVQNNSTWRLSRYESARDTVIEYHNAQSGVQAVDDPALGYWLITRGGENYGAQGRSMRPDTVLDDGIPYYQAGFTLDEGWNQLANPFPFDILWEDVRFKVGEVVQPGHPAAIEDSAYWYDGAKYIAVSTIPAWEGVFLRAMGDDVQILFPYQETGTARAPRPVESRNFAATAGQWFVKLSLSVEGRVASELFMGIRPDASEGLDRDDFASPPPPPGAPKMTLYLPDGDPMPRRCDYRPVLGEGAVWELSMTPATGRVLIVSGLDNMPDNMQAWLLPERGTPVLLTDDGSLELVNDVTSARFVIGTQSYSNREINALLPREFALDQNFPNPFNPSTNIRLALPATAEVRLDLYNLLGRRVRTLVDGPLETGYHTLAWDGTDQNGGRVASGIYFYRMTTAYFTQSRKMLLLK